MDWLQDLATMGARLAPVQQVCFCFLKIQILAFAAHLRPNSVACLQYMQHVMRDQSCTVVSCVLLDPQTLV